MQYRDFGRTGLNVSIIGFGGIVATGMPQTDVNRAVARAIDRGVNYFDFAPAYGDCEERLGPALVGKRDKVVLACKTGKKDKQGALAELHRSLDRFRTDHFDIYQFHGVGSIDDLDMIMGPNGSMDTMLEAKEKGLIRNIGITLHSQEVALEAFQRFDFDTVLFPINFICWFNGNFGPSVLEEAAKRNMGRAAIKAMAWTKWADGEERKWNKCWYRPTDDPELVRLSVRFTLSQDVHVTIPPGHLELFEMALDATDGFKPLDPDEAERLRQIASNVQSIF